MKADRNVFCESREILIYCIDGQLIPRADSADKKIGVRSLYPFRAAEIEILCRHHIILGEDGKIGKTVEMLFKIIKLGFPAYAGQNLLPNRSYHLHAVVLYETAKFLHTLQTALIPTAESQGPNAGVHKDFHAFFLCSL